MSWAGALEILFPPACAACGEIGREPFCRICEEALLPGYPFSLEGAERAKAELLYGGPVALAVQSMKYGGRIAAARSLGAILKRGIEDMEPFDRAVPVPLSRRRLAARGFNQVREMLRPVGRRVSPGVLERTHDRGPQVGRDLAAREENVRGAFRATERLDGETVLLVDDVITTGATARECTRALIDAGAARVRVIALARADDDSSSVVGRI